MNSILQPLASISPLQDYFVSGAYTNDLCKDTDLPKHFAELVGELQQAKPKVFEPRTFKSCVAQAQENSKALGEICNSVGQQDAHEFLGEFLASLHGAFLKAGEPYNKKTVIKDLTPMRAVRKKYMILPPKLHTAMTPV